MVAKVKEFKSKNKNNASKSAIRQQYGILCSSVGVFLNILLFIMKYLTGTISGSIAITADAFNNLTDCTSSIITLLGFKIAGMKANRKHPFGHGRAEYISGFIVSIVIILVGFELIRTSIEKIINPQHVEANWIVISILLISIFVKIYMFSYNMLIGKRLNSVSMKATAKDSIGDAIATFFVFACMLLNHFTGINIDGWCGIAVALFVLYMGLSSAKDTMEPLLGVAAKKEDVKNIQQLVLSYEDVIGIHDVIVHDYGPGRKMISLHAEVDGSGDIYSLHDTIDTIEKDLNKSLSCQTIIHMDPVETNNEKTSKIKEELCELMKKIDSDVSVHDFRMVPGPTRTNLLFDIVVPYKIKLDEDEIKKLVAAIVKERWNNFVTIIEVDRPYFND